MEHVKLNEFTIHTGELINCSQCFTVIAEHGERLYRSGYWREHDIIFCNAACVRAWERDKACNS